MKEINKMRECKNQLEELERQAAQLHRDNEARLFGSVFGCLVSLVVAAWFVLVFIVGY